MSDDYNSDKDFMLSYRVTAILVAAVLVTLIIACNWRFYAIERAHIEAGHVQKYEPTLMTKVWAEP